MIRGIVDVYRQATIRLRVADSDGNWHELEAIIDTGYSGYLSLPASMISALSLTAVGSMVATVADGRRSTFDTYRTKIWWDDHSQDIEIDSAEVMPLVGMSLLAGHELRIRVAEGDSVTVEALA